MNSTRSFKRLAFLALAVLAVYLSPASLRAQPVFKGSFTLSLEAQWGDAVLPPGQYTLTLDPFVAPFTVMVRGENRTALIATEVLSDREFSGRTKLVAIRSGRKLRIRALHVADAGVVLYYGLPKAEKQVTAQVPQLIQRIPVGAAGK